MSTKPQFASVVLDVDSTVSAIEGIDWLAARRGPELAREVTAMTDRAMRGEIALDAVYGDRLALIQPTRAEVDALAEAYLATVAPGAGGVIGRLLGAGVRVVLVSGGLREAILPTARALNLADDDVHAVGVRFARDGTYAGFDERSPLATQGGKPRVVEALALPAPVLAVGDGSTDLAIRPVVQAFAAFTGFVAREPVVLGADHVIDSFARLEALVLA
jgi:phosphoserine phosphatase